MPNTDTLIARIALSLWTSARKVERLPRVLEVQPWERAEIVEVPRSLNGGHFYVGTVGGYCEGI